ncbi:MAG: UPF0489 family protein [Candidatus Omnitrophota bacterium]
MKNLKNKITLFEDHTRSYYEWKKRKLNNLPLVHLDAHIDFAFFPMKKKHQILNEAKSVKELKSELEKNLVMRRFGKNLDKQENIGNYIYPAIKEGIVTDFYWILPGKVTGNTEKITRRIFKRDPFKNRLAFDKKNNTLRGKIYNHRFFVSAIEGISLPKGLLLDIDVDYLMYKPGKEKDAEKGKRRRPRLKKKDIERRPWMYPAEFARILKQRFPSPSFITISYSVNGGYTPILYKFFGDEIYLRLSGATDRNEELNDLLDEKNRAISKNEKESLLELLPKIRKIELSKPFKRRFLAHIYFWLFYLQNDGKYYRKATALDKTYRVKDNNYGWQYLKAGRLKKAASEFRRILKADPKNAQAILGISRILIRKKLYKRAISHLKRAGSSGKEICLELAHCYFSLKNLKKAEIFLKRIKGYSGRAEYLKGRINSERRPADNKKTLSHLKNAAMLGFGIKEIWKEVRRILVKGGPDYDFF